MRRVIYVTRRIVLSSERYDQTPDGTKGMLVAQGAPSQLNAQSC